MLCYYIHYQPVSVVMHARSVSSSDLGDLARIYEPTVEVVTVQRRMTRAVEQFAGALVEQRVRLELQTVIPAAATSQLDRSLGDWPATLAGAEAWLEDVRVLIDGFAELFGLEQVGVRLVTLSGPMCPRFHVDRIPARLLSTYAGSGTEWLADADVDRSRLGPAAGGVPDESSGLIRSGASIRQMTPGAVGIFKGSAWAGSHLAGAVHRSPHAAGGRLLLSLDMVA